MALQEILVILYDLLVAFILLIDIRLFVFLHLLSFVNAHSLLASHFEHFPICLPIIALIIKIVSYLSSTWVSFAKDFIAQLICEHFSL